MIEMLIPILGWVLLAVLVGLIAGWLIFRTRKPVEIEGPQGEIKRLSFKADELTNAKQRLSAELDACRQQVEVLTANASAAQLNSTALTEEELNAQAANAAALEDAQNRVIAAEIRAHEAEALAQRATAALTEAQRKQDAAEAIQQSGDGYTSIDLFKMPQEQVESAFEITEQAEPGEQVELAEQVVSELAADAVFEDEANLNETTRVDLGGEEITEPTVEPAQQVSAVNTQQTELAPHTEVGDAPLIVEGLQFASGSSETETTLLRRNLLAAQEDASSEKAQLSSLKIEVGELKNKLRQNTLLSSSVSDLQVKAGKLAGLQAQLKALRAQVGDDRADEIISAQDSVTQNASELAEAQKQLEKFKTTELELETALKRIEDYESLLSECREQNKALSEKTSEIASELTAVPAVATSAGIGDGSDVATAELQEQIKALRNQLEDTNADLFAAQAQLEKAPSASEVGALQIRVDELQKELEAQSAETAESHAPAGLATPELQEITVVDTAALEQAQSVIAEREAELEAVKAQLDLAAQEIDSSHSLLSTCRSDNAELQTAIEAFKAERHAAQQSQNSVEQAAEGSAERILQLEAELAQRQRELSQMAAMRAEITGLRQHAETSLRLQTENELLRKQLAGLSTDEDQAHITKIRSQFDKPVSQFEAPAQPSVVAQSSEQADDLTHISGVGPKLNELLHSLGITTFEQIAALDEAGVEELDAHLEGFSGRIVRDNWVAQAAEFVSEKKA